MSLISNVTKIDGLHVTTKVGGVKGVDAIRIAANGNAFVALLPGNKIWTNWDQFRNFAMMPGNRLRSRKNKSRGMMHDFLKCLVALKLITRSEMSKHVAFEKTATANAQRRYDQSSLSRLLQKYGKKDVKI